MTMVENEAVKKIPLEEVLKRVSSPDRVISANRQYLLRTVSTSLKHDNNKEVVQYRLASVDFEDPTDDVGVFLKKQEKKLIGYIDNPKSIRIPNKVHGRRSKAESEQVRQSRLKDYKFELAVIRGDIIAPLTLVSEINTKGEARIIGYSIRREEIKF